MSSQSESDAGHSEAQEASVLQHGKGVFLHAVYMTAALEAKAFLLVTGHLPVTPFFTGTSYFVEEPPITLEEFIDEVASDVRTLDELIELRRSVCDLLAATHQDARFSPPSGPVHFRGLSGQCYAAIAAELFFQHIHHAPTWELDVRMVERISAIAHDAYEKRGSLRRKDFAELNPNIYELGWHDYARRIMATCEAAYSRADDSWHLPRLLSWVEWEFSTARTMHSAEQRGSSSPGVSGRIPDHERTVPMTFRRAAKLMGKGDSKDAAEWLSASVRDGSIRAEHISRQSHVFSLRNFPANVHSWLLPAIAQPQKPKSP